MFLGFLFFYELLFVFGTLFFECFYLFVDFFSDLFWCFVFFSDFVLNSFFLGIVFLFLRFV